MICPHCERDGYPMVLCECGQDCKPCGTIHPACWICAHSLKHGWKIDKETR